MGFTAQIDLGQVIVAGVVSIIGYFIKTELSRITARLDRHDSLIFKLAQEVSEIIGASRREQNPIGVKFRNPSGME